LFDHAAPAVVDVRGGAPGTRETDLLAPGKLVRSVDAILLTGGSAFGLAAADGAMRFLRDQGRGVVTPAGPVPIVPAAVIYDLAVGQPVPPTPESGYAACRDAGPIEELERGLVGVGTGATSNKVFGNPQRGGLGVATVAWAAGSVTVLVVVNAVGAVINPSTGLGVQDGKPDSRQSLLVSSSEMGDRQATTLGIVLVNAPANETTLTRCTIAAHDAFARAIRPCHTVFDGDLVFAVGLIGGSTAPLDVLHVSTATELATERAVIDAVTA
jgi:L-aminopeptidase/D-esterase-like protein